MRKRTRTTIVWNDWVCPNCSTNNRGDRKTCQNCGGPQTEDVKFNLTDAPVLEATELESAYDGADIHCGFCHTRNPVTATKCSQCGGDLKEGEQRAHGDIFETVQDESHRDSQPSSMIDPATASFDAPPPARTYVQHSKVALPYRTEEPKRMTFKEFIQHPVVIVFGVLLTIALCYFLYWNLNVNTTTINVTLDRFKWELNIPKESFEWVEEDAYSIPEGGVEISHEDKITGYGTKKEKKWEKTGTQGTGVYYVCGRTTKDLGNGKSEVVETECEIEEDVFGWVEHDVEDRSQPTTVPYYTYKIQKWVVVDNCPSNGTDTNPEWAPCTLEDGQRFGSKTQLFTVWYTDDVDKQHSLISMDWNWFTGLHEGQVCTATRNGFGGLNLGIDCSAAVNP